MERFDSAGALLAPSVPVAMPAATVDQRWRVLQAPPGAVVPSEAERIASLESYQIMDTPPEEAYDNLVRWASQLLDVPIAVLNLLDAHRMWAKAVVGLPPIDMPRYLSICADVVALDAPVVVEDILEHPRYAAAAELFLPLGMRSYLGVPIVGRDGLALGTMCIVGHGPRRVTARDIGTLTALAQQAGALLDLRRNEVRTGLAPQGSTCDRLVPDAHDPRMLRRAVRRDEFVPYFQPVVDLAADRVIGYEALVRWMHPTLGTLTPDRFLPAFEASELILSLDDRVLNHALAALSRLRRRCDAAGRHVAVNVSGRELTKPGLAARVAAALERHAMCPADLAIEVTETTETNPVIRRAELLQLRELGVGVLIDDYGSGYANTCAMLDTPATGVKIDRSIVSRIASDERARVVLAGVTAEAMALGLEVIAEGVEDHRTARIAADCGVQLAQGYAFGRPAPESDIC
jgi:EAL domain-containing protein (putative c-di-GMP-specific phosphodiesterase class I)